jgi:hypothetical protein
MLALRAIAKSKEPMTRTALAAQLDTRTESLWRSVKPLIAADHRPEVSAAPGVLHLEFRKFRSSKNYSGH